MKQLLNSILKSILGQYYFDLVYWYFAFRKIPEPITNRPRMIIFNHFFDQDIEALRRANTQFELIVLDASAFRFVATQIFPATVEQYSVFNSPDLDAVKTFYKKMVERCLEKIIKKYSPDAFVTPSDNFFYIRQFIEILQSKKIPCIVLDKEGTICPAYFEHFAKYIRETSPFISDYILVWSGRQKLFWEKTGVMSEKIRVVGQPRSDFWKQPKRWLPRTELRIPGLRPDSPILLYFSYDPWSYTPEYMVAKGEMHWDVLREETDQTIFSFAQNHPEIDIIIKVHPQQSDIAKVQAMIQKAQLPNIFLVTGAALSNQLIINSNVILGFQSTALIESMVTDKPIIYTFWGEARDRWSNDLIPFHQNTGISIAQSPDELNKLLTASFHDETLQPRLRTERDAFIHEYLSVVDGLSSSRALNAIKSLTSLSHP